MGEADRGPVLGKRVLWVFHQGSFLFSQDFPCKALAPGCASHQDWAREVT